MDVVVVGQVARDLVVGVDEVPAAGGATAVRHRWEGLGGKGANQAVAAAQLGARVALVGVVGDDEPGRAVLQQAAADGLDTGGVVRRPGAVTALLVDLVTDGGSRRLLEDVAEDVLLRPADLDGAARLIASARAVLVQLQQPAAAVRAALRLCREAPAIVVVDGAPDDPAVREEVLARATVVRADAHEAELLVGRELDGVQAVERAARELVTAGPRLVVLAAGAQGEVVAWPGGSAVLPLVPVPVADPTGGGDTLTAALTVALLRGDEPERAVRWASAAAALTVQRLGGRPALDHAAVEELVRRA